MNILVAILATFGGMFAIAAVVLIGLYVLLQRPRKDGGSPFE